MINACTKECRKLLVSTTPMIGKHKLFAVFLLLLNSLCQAQVLDWSNTQKLRGNSIYTSIIGEDESGIYVFRHRNKLLSKFVVMERYRHNLGLENSKSYLLKNSRILYADVNAIGLMTLKQVYDKKTNTFNILASYLNNSFELVSEEKLVLQLKGSDWGTGPSVIIKPSPDHTSYLIFCYEISNPKNSIYKYAEINSKMSILNTDEVRIPSEFSIDKLLDIVVDNELNYTFIANSRKTRKGYSSLVVFEQMGDSNSIKLLNDSNYYLENPLLFYNPVSKTKGITGFYTSSKEAGIEGTFLYLWKNQVDKPLYKLQPFSASVIRQLEGESSVSNGFLPSTYGPIKSVCRTDGGFIVVSENSFTQKDQDIMVINGVPSTQGKSIYNYENLLIQNFDSLGILQWENWVIKNQTTVNDGGMLGSIYVSATENAIHILYNDPIASGGDVLLATIKSNGDKEFKVVSKGDEMNAFIIPSEARQISKDKIIVPVLKDRKFALLKITFK